MTAPMKRFVSACVAFAAMTGIAHADTGMLENGAMLEWPRLFIREGEELKEPSDSETLLEHMNLASCQCSQQGDASRDLYYELHLSSTTGTNRAGQIWVGSGCDDDITRPMNCRQVSTIGDIDALAIREETFPVPLYDLINASPSLVTPTKQPCRQEDGGEAFVWVIVDTNGDSQPDFFSPRPIDLETFTDVAGFDTLPPPPLEDLKAQGGENAIELSWTIPETRPTDFFAFQAFCMDSTGAPVGAGGGALYSTTESVCGMAPPEPRAFTAQDLTSTDGTPVTSLPIEFAALNPAFICDTVESQTASSLTIRGLENNAEYTVALVAVDRSGNAAGTFFTRTVVPRAVTDFWEDVDQRGGKIEGGFCSTSSPVGLGGMLAVLASAWLWRRRRRLPRKWLVRGAGGLALVLVPAGARADDFAPYWEDPGTETAGFLADQDEVKWHAGIKVGPYTPDIDKQVGVNSTTGMGPYQAMFGNYYTRNAQGELVGNDAHVYQILPMLDVERIIWTGAGQVGIGGTLGYMQKTAYAYVENSDASQVRRERSTASENTFRLIPFALTATYRLTQLDDLYGIPIVPYLRGGLSYYVWWLKGPSGDIAKVCKDGSMTDGCEANKAYGGTLGVQASVGLAIRAERIDKDAARSMRQSGIQHAGFFAELMFAKVNGLGSDTKLSVGDNTWFGGVNFEF